MPTKVIPASQSQVSESVLDSQETTCCIVGGGPGMANVESLIEESDTVPMKGHSQSKWARFVARLVVKNSSSIMIPHLLTKLWLIVKLIGSIKFWQTNMSESASTQIYRVI